MILSGGESDRELLAVWQTPPYPPRIRRLQYENEIVVDITQSGWRMHNRPNRQLRGAVFFFLFVLSLGIGCGWLVHTLAPSLSHLTVWMWTAYATAWVIFCGIGGMLLDRWFAKGRPALLAVDAEKSEIVESTNPAVKGGRLVSVILRVGKKPDPEMRSGQPIVQVAAVFDRTGTLRVEPLWTFLRPFWNGAATELMIESRLRAICAAQRFEVVVVNGQPELARIEV